MQSATMLETIGKQSSFPLELRGDLEDICDSKDVKNACKTHEKKSGLKLLDKFFKNRLSLKGYSVKADKLRLANTKFDLDLLIAGQDWQAAILIEGGQAARIELDLLKLAAWSKNEAAQVPKRYAVLIVSDKNLVRSITGTKKGETAFHYIRRLFPLFHGTAPNLNDLLSIEFKCK